MHARWTRCMKGKAKKGHLSLSISLYIERDTYVYIIIYIYIYTYIYREREIERERDVKHMCRLYIYIYINSDTKRCRCWVSPEKKKSLINVFKVMFLVGSPFSDPLWGPCPSGRRRRVRLNEYEYKYSALRRFPPTRRSALGICACI